MRTEDLPLYIKEIFDRKKVKYNKFDVARMRYLCKTFVEFVVTLNETQSKRHLPMEKRSKRLEADGDR